MATTSTAPRRSRTPSPPCSPAGRPSMSSAWAASPASRIDGRAPAEGHRGGDRGAGVLPVPRRTARRTCTTASSRTCRTGISSPTRRAISRSTARGAPCRSRRRSGLQGPGEARIFRAEAAAGPSDPRVHGDRYRPPPPGGLARRSDGGRRRRRSSRSRPSTKPRAPSRSSWRSTRAAACGRPADAVKAAARSFVDALRPEDQLAVMRFSDRAGRSSAISRPRRGDSLEGDRRVRCRAEARRSTMPSTRRSHASSASKAAAWWSC